MPKTVALTVGGIARTVTTTAPTVGQLLAEQHLQMGPLDQLSAALSAPLVQGLSVILTRIEHRQMTARESVRFGTIRTSTSSMFTGQSKVLKPGHMGSRIAVYDVVITDGAVTTRRLLSATILVAPVSQILQVGTKAQPANVGGSVDSLNWAALADCESGGNPKAVNPAGYYGLYQFSVSTWHSVGGSGLPSNASSSEQTLRAKLLYQKAGAGQWPVCGRRLFT